MNGRGLKQVSGYAGRTILGGGRVGFSAMRLHPRLGPRLVGPETDACIEGYPRSANSLAVHAFLMANPAVRVAHHVHVPMQAVRSVELGIPCVILVREPVDAIASLLIMSDGALPPPLAIRSYTSFYDRVAELRDEVAIAPFASVIDDPFGVVRALNDRFGTGYAVPEDAGPDAVRARVQRANVERGRPESEWAVPSDRKRELKPRIVSDLRGRRGMKRAQRVYDSLAD